MRIWQFEDTQAVPTDLVLEQDFILRIRRLQRLGTQHLVINLTLSTLEAIIKSRRALEAMQQRVKEFSKITNGVYAEMSNGDAFIIWEETHDAPILVQRLAEALLPNGQEIQDRSKFIHVYHVPLDYTALRERANDYVELVRTASTRGSEADASHALKSAHASGPLTPWSVDQIDKLLNDIDLGRYGRTQAIGRRQADGSWQQVSEEHFVSFEELKRERFPKLDIITPEHLFLALCQTLDKRLLASIAAHPETISGRNVHLNLSVGMAVNSVFAQFVHSVPKDRRHRVCFEIHRGDLLQDFTQTLNVLDLLRNEGFKIAFDSLTPDMIPYMHFDLFGVDYLKINVSKDRNHLLDDAGIRKSLEQLPAEKLIFFRCDNEKALAAGLELGITYFQGWLIDKKIQT